jgi:simple sugar transport system ATP-binding protein
MVAIRQRIRDLALGGVAIVVISNDLDELLDLSDRVAVLDAGRIAGVVDTGPGAEARIGELILGVAAAPAG